MTPRQRVFWWLRFHRKQAAIGAIATAVVIGSCVGLVLAWPGSSYTQTVADSPSNLVLPPTTPVVTTTVAPPATVPATTAPATTVPRKAPPRKAVPHKAAPRVTTVKKTVPSTTVPKKSTPPTTVRPTTTTTTISPRVQLQRWVTTISDPAVSRIKTDVAGINAAFNAGNGKVTTPLKQAGLTLQNEATTDARQPAAPNAQVAAAWAKVLNTSKTVGTYVGGGAGAGPFTATHMTQDENALVTALQQFTQAESENGVS